MKEIYEKYTKAGLSVIPERNKKPVRAWKPFQKRLPTQKDWGTWPSESAIGIICGKVSGNLEAIDIDDGKVYDEFIEILALDYKLQDKLTIQRTPSGGAHLIYRCEQIQGIENLAFRPGADGRKELIIEIKGEGGKFTAAPTDGYKVIAGDLTNIQQISLKDRLALIEIAQSFNTYEEPKREYKPGKFTAPTDGNAPGDEYNRAGEFASVLIQAGWQIVRTIGNVQHWRRPGKKDGISATFNAVPGKFYNFSGNATPFEAYKTYTPFAIYALLNHNGDFSAAAKVLHRQGYGKKGKKSMKLKQKESFVNDELTQVEPDDPLDYWSQIEHVKHSELVKKVHDRKGYLPKFIDISETYHGIHGITILSGDAWSGKSTFALALAKDFIEQDIPCIYYTMEMDTESLVKRIDAMVLGQDENEIYRNYKSFIQNNIEQIQEFEQKLYVRDMIEIDRIIEDIENVRVEHPDRDLFIVIDYLHLIPTQGQNLKDRIDIVLNKLRKIYSMASHGGRIAFLVISEITKETGRGITYGMNLSALRQQLFSGGMGSAQIHYAADFYIAILRDLEANRAKIVFLKNKHGGKLPGKNPMELYFNPTGLIYEQI